MMGRGLVRRPEPGNDGPLVNNDKRGKRLLQSP